MEWPASRRRLLLSLPPSRAGSVWRPPSQREWRVFARCLPPLWKRSRCAYCSRLNLSLGKAVPSVRDLFPSAPTSPVCLKCWLAASTPSFRNLLGAKAGRFGEGSAPETRFGGRLTAFSLSWAGAHGPAARLALNRSERLGLSRFSAPECQDSACLDNRSARMQQGLPKQIGFPQPPDNRVPTGQRSGRSACNCLPPSVPQPKKGLRDNSPSSLVGSWKRPRPSLERVFFSSPVANVSRKIHFSY